MFDAVNACVAASEAVPGVAGGKLFGKPCYKTGGKAFVCFFCDEMVFKRPGDAHARALAAHGYVRGWFFGC
jgi:hypothetical protein